MDEFKNSDGPEITASMILTGMEFLPKISVKLINFISRNFLPGLFLKIFLPIMFVQVPTSEEMEHGPQE